MEALIPPNSTPIQRTDWGLSRRKHTPQGKRSCPNRAGWSTGAAAAALHALLRLRIHGQPATNLPIQKTWRQSCCGVMYGGCLAAEPHSDQHMVMLAYGDVPTIFTSSETPADISVCHFATLPQPSRSVPWVWPTLVCKIYLLSPHLWQTGSCRHGALCGTTSEHCWLILQLSPAGCLSRGDGRAPPQRPYLVGGGSAAPSSAHWTGWQPTSSGAAAPLSSCSWAARQAQQLQRQPWSRWSAWWYSGSRSTVTTPPGGGAPTARPSCVQQREGQV